MILITREPSSVHLAKELSYERTTRQSMQPKIMVLAEADWPKTSAKAQGDLGYSDPPPAWK
jgi:hypothetical protein